MAEIRFRDDAGWQWGVVERTHRRSTGDQSAEHRRSLYFLSRYETRRIDDFPADWAKRPSKDLMELWADAEPL